MIEDSDINGKIVNDAIKFKNITKDVPNMTPPNIPGKKVYAKGDQNALGSPPEVVI